MNARAYTITPDQGKDAAVRQFREMFDQMLRSQVNTSAQWQTNAMNACSAMFEAIAACGGDRAMLHDAFSSAMYEFGEDIRKDDAGPALLPALGFLLEVGKLESGAGNSLTRSRVDNHFEALIESIARMRRHAETVHHEVGLRQRRYWDGPGGTRLSPRDCSLIPLSVPFGMKQVFVDDPHHPSKGGLGAARTPSGAVN